MTIPRKLFIRIQFICVLSVIQVLLTSQALAQGNSPSAVSALGRLEPENGVIRINAPSTSRAISGSVISKLEVAEGDWVEAGELIATLDSAALMQTELEVSRASLQQTIRASEAAVSDIEEACTRADVAINEAARRADLAERQLASTEEAEQARGDADARSASCTAARARARVAEAAIETARLEIIVHEAEVERARVRAPFSGQVLEIHAHEGEFTTPHGVLDLGRTNDMFAIAEVYESDISRVQVGQSARITSRALAQTLTGKVERIRGQVHKQDVTGTDPAAAKDARIIEVEIRLDDSEVVSGLTNLQVAIVIGG